MQQYYDKLIAKLPKFDNPEFYEVRAVEQTAVAVINFEHFYQYILGDLEVLRFYTHATEELFMITEQLHNNQLTLTSEEYLEWLPRFALWMPLFMGRTALIIQKCFSISAFIS